MPMDVHVLPALCNKCAVPVLTDVDMDELHGQKNKARWHSEASTEADLTSSTWRAPFHCKTTRNKRSILQESSRAGSLHTDTMKK